MADYLQYGPYVGAVVLVGVGVGVAVWKSKGRRQKPVRVCERDYPRDTVVVHQYFSGPHAPSLGHFTMKLETYLRITKIPYISCTSAFDLAPKGKIPWIEYNGKTIADSQFCIEFLNKEFNVDLNASLSREQRAHAHALRKMVEEFTYWLHLYSRWWIHLEDMIKLLKIPCTWWAMRNMPPMLRDNKTMASAQGVGRHSNEEIEKLFADDLQVLSDFLGDKKFFMGSDVSEVDCAVFGQLAEIKWHTPSACKAVDLLNEKHTNLTEFIERMKDAFWPDWNDCFKNGSLNVINC